ncbi:HEAT repeat domain-containing protein [Candidatus Latescibacterota bacterium]
MTIPDLMTSFSANEILLIGTIFFLLFLVLVLLSYAIMIRVFVNARNLRINRLHRKWESVLFQYLEQQSRFRDIAGTTETQNLNQLEIQHRDWMIFGEFIENFLVDIEGKDNDRIIQMLWELKFFDHLMKALNNKNVWIKAYSAHFLGLMKYVPAENKLTELTYDTNPIVSISAFDALHKLGSHRDIRRIIKDVLNNADLSYTRISEIISGYGAETDAILVSLLDDDEVIDSAKTLLINVITSKNIPESLPIIKKLIYWTKSRELIIGCIKAIAAFGDSDFIPFIQTQMFSSDWIIRSQAVKALGEIGSSSVIPAIRKIIVEDTEFWVRLYGAQALWDFGQEGVNALEDVIAQNDDDELRKILHYVVYENESEE